MRKIIIIFFAISISLNAQGFKMLLSTQFGNERSKELLAANSDTTNLGILTANYIDFEFTVQNINAFDSLDMHQWLNLQPPFYLTSFPMGWLIMPQDSGTFGMRINHLGVDTVYSVNVGFVGSDVADSYRDTLWHTFIVDMQTNSNTLLAATNLTASSVENGIFVSWSDSNVADTVIDVSNTFTTDESSEWNLSSGTLASVESNKLKVTRSSSTSAWQFVYRTIAVRNDRFYEFSVDYDEYNTVSGWMVVKGYRNDSSFVLYNVEALTDSSFYYSINNPNYDSLRCYLQIKTSASGQYSYFDNFLLRKTESSYDGWQLQKLAFVDGAPYGEWTDLESQDNDNTSYLHQSTTFADTTEYAYRVRFNLDDINSEWSNLDTAIFNYEEPIAVVADYWIRPDGGTTMAEAADSSIGITVDAISTKDDSIGVNKIIAIKGTNIGTLDLDGAGGKLDGLQVINYIDGVVTLYDIVPGWSTTGNWSNNGDSSWTYILPAPANYFGIHRLWLDDKEYPTAIPPDWENYDLIADSTWAVMGDSVRWLDTLTSYSAQSHLRVWTPNGTNPASYYTSIKQAAIHGSSDVSTYAMRFQHIDYLTVKGITAEGGDFITLSAEYCDNVVIKNNTVRKVHQNGIRVTSSHNAQVLNNVVHGLTGMAGDSYHSEYLAQGIDVVWDSPNSLVKGNTIYNVATQSIRFYGRYGYGSPNYSIMDSNTAINNEGLMYARPFQSTGDENHKIDGQYAMQPKDIYVTRNLFVNMTIDSKINSENLYFMFNIWVGATINGTYLIDHKKIRTTNDGYVFEAIGQLGLGVKYIYNNTFINIPRYFFRDYGSFNEFHLVNNLLLDMNRQDYYPGIDLRITDADGFQVYNNYSWNSDNPTNRVMYLGVYKTWAGFESAVSGSHYARNNILDNTSVNINSILQDAANGDYDAVLSNSYIINNSRVLPFSLPSWLTKDRYGNPISTTGNNIGAVNN